MSILVNYLSVHSLNDDMDREAPLPLLVLLMLSFRWFVAALYNKALHKPSLLLLLVSGDASNNEAVIGKLMGMVVTRVEAKS